MAESLTRSQTEAKINVRAWKDPIFRQQLATNPHLALKEMGMSKVPSGLKIQIVEEQKEEWVIRLQKRPLNFQDLTDEALEKIACGEPQEAKCCPPKKN